MFIRKYSADGGNGAVADAPDVDKGGNGQGGQGAADTATRIEPTQIASYNHHKGINEERQRFADDLRKYGVEPVMDEMGKIDRTASLAALVEALKKNGAAADDPKKAKPAAGATTDDASNEDFAGKERVYQAQLEAAKQKALQHEEEAKTAREEAKRIMEQSYIASAFTGAPVLEGHGDMVMKLFKLERKVEMLQGGDVHVYKGKELIYVDDGKGSVRPATVAEAARMFLEEYPALMAPSARPQNSAGAAQANVRTATWADVQAGRVKAEDMASGAVKIIG